MKATGIVRRIDDLGWGCPSRVPLTLRERFCAVMIELEKRVRWGSI